MARSWQLERARYRKHVADLELWNSILHTKDLLSENHRLLQKMKDTREVIYNMLIKVFHGDDDATNEICRWHNRDSSHEGSTTPQTTLVAGQQEIDSEQASVSTSVRGPGVFSQPQVIPERGATPKRPKRSRSMFSSGASPCTTSALLSSGIVLEPTLGTCSTSSDSGVEPKVDASTTFSIATRSKIPLPGQPADAGNRTSSSPPPENPAQHIADLGLGAVSNGGKRRMSSRLMMSSSIPEDRSTPLTARSRRPQTPEPKSRTSNTLDPVQPTADTTSLIPPAITGATGEQHVPGSDTTAITPSVPNRVLSPSSPEVRPLEEVSSGKGGDNDSWSGDLFSSTPRKSIMNLTFRTFANMCEAEERTPRPPSTALEISCLRRSSKRTPHGGGDGGDARDFQTAAAAAASDPIHPPKSSMFTALSEQELEPLRKLSRRSLLPSNRTLVSASDPKRRASCGSVLPSFGTRPQRVSFCPTVGTSGLKTNWSCRRLSAAPSSDGFSFPAVSLFADAGSSWLTQPTLLGRSGRSHTGSKLPTPSPIEASGTVSADACPAVTSFGPTVNNSASTESLDTLEDDVIDKLRWSYCDRSFLADLDRDPCEQTKPALGSTRPPDRISDLLLSQALEFPSRTCSSKASISEADLSSVQFVVKVDRGAQVSFHGSHTASRSPSPDPDLVQSHTSPPVTDLGARMHTSRSASCKDLSPRLCQMGIEPPRQSGEASFSSQIIVCPSTSPAVYTRHGIALGNVRVSTNRSFSGTSFSTDVPTITPNASTTDASAPVGCRKLVDSYLSNSTYGASDGSMLPRARLVASYLSPNHQPTGGVPEETSSCTGDAPLPSACPCCQRPFASTSVVKPTLPTSCFLNSSEHRSKRRSRDDGDLHNRPDSVQKPTTGTGCEPAALMEPVPGSRNPSVSDNENGSVRCQNPPAFAPFKQEDSPCPPQPSDLHPSTSGSTNTDQRACWGTARRAPGDASLLTGSVLVGLSNSTLADGTTVSSVVPNTGKHRRKRKPFLPRGRLKLRSPTCAPNESHLAQSFSFQPFKTPKGSIRWRRNESSMLDSVASSHTAQALGAGAEGASMAICELSPGPVRPCQSVVPKSEPPPVFMLNPTTLPRKGKPSRRLPKDKGAAETLLKHSSPTAKGAAETLLKHSSPTAKGAAETLLKHSSPTAKGAAETLLKHSSSTAKGAAETLLKHSSPTAKGAAETLLKHSSPTAKGAAETLLKHSSPTAKGAAETLLKHSSPTAKGVAEVGRQTHASSSRPASRELPTCEAELSPKVSQDLAASAPDCHPPLSRTLNSRRKSVSWKLQPASVPVRCLPDQTMTPVPTPSLPVIKEVNSSPSDTEFSTCNNNNTHMSSGSRKLSPRGRVSALIVADPVLQQHPLGVSGATGDPSDDAVKVSKVRVGAKRKNRARMTAPYQRNSRTNVNVSSKVLAPPLVREISPRIPVSTPSSLLYLDGSNHGKANTALSSLKVQADLRPETVAGDVPSKTVAASALTPSVTTTPLSLDQGDNCRQSGGVIGSTLLVLSPDVRSQKRRSRKRLTMPRSSKANTSSSARAHRLPRCSRKSGPQPAVPDGLPSGSVSGGDWVVAPAVESTVVLFSALSEKVEEHPAPPCLLAQQLPKTDAEQRQVVGDHFGQAPAVEVVPQQRKRAGKRARLNPLKQDIQNLNSPPPSTGSKAKKSRQRTFQGLNVDPPPQEDVDNRSRSSSSCETSNNNSEQCVAAPMQPLAVTTISSDNTQVTITTSSPPPSTTNASLPVPVNTSASGCSRPRRARPSRPLIDPSPPTDCSRTRSPPATPSLTVRTRQSSQSESPWLPDKRSPRASKQKLPASRSSHNPLGNISNRTRTSRLSAANSSRAHQYAARSMKLSRMKSHPWAQTVPDTSTPCRLPASEFTSCLLSMNDTTQRSTTATSLFRKPPSNSRLHQRRSTQITQYTSPRTVIDDIVSMKVTRTEISQSSARPSTTSMSLIGCPQTSTSQIATRDSPDFSSNQLLSSGDSVQHAGSSPSVVVTRKRTLLQLNCNVLLPQDTTEARSRINSPQGQKQIRQQILRTSSASSLRGPSH